MAYIIGDIAAFVDGDDQRCEKPEMFTASDGRSYTKVVLSEDCPDGVQDFSDGECYTVFASESILTGLKKGATIRVSAKE